MKKCFFSQNKRFPSFLKLIDVIEVDHIFSANYIDNFSEVQNPCKSAVAVPTYHWILAF
jgi:hypothetical protein